MKMHNLLGGTLLMATLLTGFPAWASHGPTEVGGATMYPTNNIVENALNSGDHETLVAAIKAAGLVDTLQGEGPFTVFAPVDSAFNRLPSGTVPMLLKPENKSQLQSVLTYHVVPGNMDRQALSEAVMKAGGSAQLETVNGAMLTVKKNGNNLVVEDNTGTVANISTYDVSQANGVIHVIDRVLMPGS
ncbi:fasciclin domain-containing protein [Halomonas sp. IOP_31]|uniref:fasciclin domain-containing protein n=1 Tax=Halomonas sp. IOP_31 TaxID=2876584 RepID=UPI001E5F8ABD|nr:fasciclin domain-containing protein [Halomonas sp. IOP_31]MCD6006836.1 fasciclin domain-containing protein [Halomonas sp. IOP_31]